MKNDLNAAAIRKIVWDKAKYFLPELEIEKIVLKTLNQIDKDIKHAEWQPNRNK